MKGYHLLRLGSFVHFGNTCSLSPNRPKIWNWTLRIARRRRPLAQIKSSRIHRITIGGWRLE